MAGKIAKKSVKAARKAGKKAVAGRVTGKAAKPRKAAPAPGAASTPTAANAGIIAGPRMLSGGNPQIAKGYGTQPVQAYIAAMPGWKSDIGRRIDALIERDVPGVRKAVKWNSPFYGASEEGQGWFLNFHCFAKYIKVAFFRGTSLRPLPPGESKHKEVRYYDIYEGRFDEDQFVDWVKQASMLPGERM